MKQVNKEEIQKLIDEKIIVNTPRGYVDKRGYTVGFYKTRNKRYLEDRFVDIARTLP